MLTPRQSHAIAAACVLPLAALTLAGCERAGAETPQPKAAPAKVTAAESGGAPTLELTSAADERLGITLFQVEKRTVPRVRVLSGELVVPPGARAELTAPYAAVVSFGERLAAAPGQVGRLGAEQGEVLFTLTPLLSAEGERAAALQRVQLTQALNQLELARTQSTGAVERARARLDGARTAFERAEALVREQAGSLRARDEARAELEAAQAELSSAEHEQALLATQSLQAELTDPSPLVIAAPFAGELLELGAAAGQLVPAGARLGVLERHDPLWIRVAVFAGEPLGPVGESARLVGLDGRVAPDAPEARAIAGLPSADAAHATLDRWFELPNRARALRPGQRVSVALPWTGAEERLVVPWSALVFDVQGGAWVYEHLGETRYRRVAVELERALGAEAILVRGPAPGASVVAVGVAELFGTEFGTGK
jgi:membrane fusion protein, heavy metal efflux system